MRAYGGMPLDDPEVPLQAREFGTLGLLGPESAGELAGLMVVDGPVRMSEVVHQRRRSP